MLRFYLGGRELNMIGYLYILATRNNHYYIGSTNNLKRRLIEHKSGKTKSLKKLLQFNLVFYKKYSSAIKSRKAEIRLKKFKSRKIIEKIIKSKNVTIKI